MTYDRKLLTASMNGDQQAFALLYDEIYPELYRMAIYMSGNVTIADDLVSETVLLHIKASTNSNHRRHLKLGFLKLCPL